MGKYKAVFTCGYCYNKCEQFGLLKKKICYVEKYFFENGTKKRNDMNSKDKWQEIQQTMQYMTRLIVHYGLYRVEFGREKGRTRSITNK